MMQVMVASTKKAEIVITSLPLHGWAPGSPTSTSSVMTVQEIRPISCSHVAVASLCLFPKLYLLLTSSVDDPCDWYHSSIIFDVFPKTFVRLSLAIHSTEPYPGGSLWESLVVVIRVATRTLRRAELQSSEIRVSCKTFRSLEIS